MSADIFISFASKDVKVAMTLCQALETRGFNCWISARDIEPGANFQSSIVQALRTARVMLLVFTANSNNSEEMTKELALASQRKIMVIPLRVEDVTPNDAFAYEFATRQWIDAFADWEFSLDQLSRRIGQALKADDGARAPIASAPPAEVAAAEIQPEIAAPAETPAASAEPEDALPEPEPAHVLQLSPKARVVEATPEASNEAERDQFEPAEAVAAQGGGRRRLAIVAIGAVIAVAAAATVALNLKGHEPAAPKVAAAPMPRLATAVTVEPQQAEPQQAEPEATPEEQPKLIKTARPKKTHTERATEDIPF